MTTLAIIGNGIQGRSLIYTLAKEEKSFEKITLFYSDNFTFPCSFHSTAIVAPRGLSPGHSPLGDLLLEGFQEFSSHIKLNAPEGVEVITQFSAATEKLESFKARYPAGEVTTHCGDFHLKNSTYVARDEAYLIDPKTYLNWLSTEAQMQEGHHLEVIQDLVTEVTEAERVHIKTQDGRNMAFDKVVFATGTYSRFWSPILPQSKLKTSKPAQGSYLEFNNVHWPIPSFSLTLDGDNLIWNAPLKRLLVGSTTHDVQHVMPPINELRFIFDRLQSAVDLKFPSFESGLIKVGLREKAQKREPYLFMEGRKIFVGGLYKNGYTLSLKMAKDLSRQFL